MQVYGYLLLSNDLLCYEDFLFHKKYNRIVILLKRSIQSSYHIRIMLKKISSFAVFTFLKSILKIIKGSGMNCVTRAYFDIKV